MIHFGPILHLAVYNMWCWWGDSVQSNHRIKPWLKLNRNISPGNAVQLLLVSPGVEQEAHPPGHVCLAQLGVGS